MNIHKDSYLGVNRRIPAFWPIAIWIYLKILGTPLIWWLISIFPSKVTMVLGYAQLWDIARMYYFWTGWTFLSFWIFWGSYIRFAVLFFGWMLLVCNAGMSMHKNGGEGSRYFPKQLIGNHEHGEPTKTTRAWYFTPGCNARGAAHHRRTR